jgi:hypothetical protein
MVKSDWLQVGHNLIMRVGNRSGHQYDASSNVTVMTNIDNPRNSQVNYNKKKKQAPFTQYGPYPAVAGISDSLSANGAVDHNQFEVMSAGSYPIYKSPQTMQEFQYSNGNRIDDSLSDNYGASSNAGNVPSYHKMKDKLHSMRRQNISNVTSNILNNNKISKPSKAEIMRTKSVDDESDSSNFRNQYKVSNSRPCS